ncbi:hypothetical protein EJ05DRAFT_244013 [Pseudovirgaria hyperparasitica]|uniref:J domain-containing protein n=1 Tax=Pseudovirgaria hyperparasitica TaxID=470096 RepID=A0A6A6WFM9_9PEZI|nr:uncharacterized protein EJ05DRAFT_244013 [Pseudovirgaria hyperparasitica]KAF2760854.1 hypothetical protein EJ05DRAFT_244013 [Pseudovirgaria hyperparasitica]
MMQLRGPVLTFPFNCLQCSTTSPKISVIDATRESIRPRRRTYAQVHSKPHEDLYSWPVPEPPHRTPTPYQILHHKPSDRYSKTPFYQLVKLYHPDLAKADSRIRALPPHILAERYRLIIAAHTILSDPVRRSAYDRFGAGWSASSTLGSSSSTTGKSSWYYPYDSHMDSSYKAQRERWRPGESPMGNATWEDWEAWRKRVNPDGHTQKPIYVSNGTMVMFVLCLTAVGASLQNQRIEVAAEKWEDLQERVNRESAKDLRHVREAGRAAGDTEESIQYFLDSRAGKGEKWQKEALRKMLPRKEVCESGGVAGDVK